MVSHHPYPRLFLESLPMRHHGVKNDGEMSFEAGKPSFVSISSMDFINSNHLYQFHQSQENQKLENRFLGQFLTRREFGLYGLNNHMESAHTQLDRFHVLDVEIDTLISAS